MLMIIAALAILGLCMGSFINALVWRLRQQENSKQKAINGKRYSIVKGRSLCPHCKHELSSKDLIPLLSWAFLRGRCRYCDKSISIQYPLVEGTTAALFVASYIFWPQELIGAAVVDFAVWLTILVGLIALAVYDIRWMILPNRIIFPLYGLAGANILLQSVFVSDITPLTSALWGVLVGGGIFYLLFQVSGGKWIGGGDVKLGFLLGAIAGGPLEAFLILFIASFLGSVFSIPMLVRKSLGAKAKIAFGPFLIVAAIIVCLFSGEIIDLYNNLLML